MISPELLKRYPFFASLSEDQLKSLAMIGEELEFEKEKTIVKEGSPADALYLIIEGSADLFFDINDEKTNTHRQFLVGEITTGDPFGITALLEPYTHISSVRTATPCKVVKLPANPLRELVENDPQFAMVLIKNIALAALERLNNTRIQLAAAWA